jgi:hypothetical protein
LSDQTQQEDAAGIARDVLDTLQTIEEQARHGLTGDSYLTGDSIGVMNSLRETAALQTLDRMNSEKATSFLTLSREPAIARVVVTDQDGARHTYYICRAQPPAGLSRVPLISYRSPLGAIASRGVGTTFVRKDGREVEVRQRVQLRPFKEEVWDSRDSIFESEDFDTITVRSLRDLLAPALDKASEDVLAALLAEEEAAGNVLAGIRRSVIKKMGLRDQALLDAYQDGIFRLPLASRLLILGPPGTGKTTTLIRRLGQKLDIGALDEAESALVQRMDEGSELPHTQSWLMFTPTDLLRQYVREAFNREGIAAPEQRISTWADYRHDLARNHFGILRTAMGSGIFVLKEAPTLTSSARERPIDWYEDFDQWQRESWLNTVRQSMEQLRNDADMTIAALATPALDALSGATQELASASTSHWRPRPRSLDSLSAARSTWDRFATSLSTRRDSTFLHRSCSRRRAWAPG